MKYISKELEYFFIVASKKGDRVATQALVTAHFGFIKMHALKILKTNKRFSGVEFEDYLQVAYEGFFAAIGGFRLESKLRLLTFADWTIRTKLLRFLKNENEHFENLYLFEGDDHTYNIFEGTKAAGEDGVLVHKFINFIKQKVTPRKFKIFEESLAGYSQYIIAEHFNCSHQCISQILLEIEGLLQSSFPDYSFVRMQRKPHALSPWRSIPLDASINREQPPIELRMPGEIWKNIPNSDGYYTISNLGRIWSTEHKVSCKGGATRVHKGKFLKIGARALIGKENIYFGTKRALLRKYFTQAEAQESIC